VNAPLRLWSIQGPEVWELLRTRGAYAAQAHHISPAWRHAYRWMRTQMLRRLGDATAVGQMPVWAWRCWRGQERLRPDLRCGGHLPAGAHGVLLTLQMTASRVLLSDFELWHYVLNGWYLPAGRSDERRFERSAALLPAAARNRQIEASWQRIFEPVVLRAPYTAPRRTRAVQAVFWALRLEDVVEARPFVAR
jgi:Domain of unknown function (DUF3841)